MSGKIEDIEDYGSYWYDDSKTKTNGEFDCVIRRNGEVYDFYECKYYNHPMPSKECHIEKEQLLNIKGIDVSNIGFICTGGFQAVNDNDYILIDGDMLFE